MAASKRMKRHHALEKIPFPQLCSTYLSLSSHRRHIALLLRVHLKTGHPESFNILRQTLLNMLATFLDFADSFSIYFQDTKTIHGLSHYYMLIMFWLVFGEFLFLRGL